MIYVNSISISPASLTLKKGDWYYRIRANVLPVNASATSVEWTSSDPAIASVGKSNGYIYANAPGTATIIATALDGSGKHASCRVVVLPDTKVQVTPSTLTIYEGSSYLLEKTVTHSGSESVEISWSSSDESIVTVNHASGLVRAVKAGTATIYATAKDASQAYGTCVVTVLPVIKVSSVAVSPSTLNLSIGQTGVLSAAVSPSDATNPSITWVSGSPSVAAVTKTGFVTAVSSGTCCVFARTNDGSGTYGTCYVTVRQPTAIQVTPAELTMYEGTSQLLSAAITPAGASDAGVSWTSLNPDIAEVNHASGLVTAICAGTARIRATALDGSEAYDECEVTVLPLIRVQSVTVAPAQLTVRIDGTAELSATVLPANATNKTLRWHTDNEDILSVSETTGDIYAYTAGTAHVYATAQDGSNKFGVCTVTVPAPTAVTVTPAEVTLYEGESRLLSAIITPAEAENTSISWSSLNPDIAEVNHASGLLTAVSAGTVTIRALALDGSLAAGYCTVTVLPYVPVESVTVTPANLTLEAGKHANLNATILPANATNREIRWTSDNSKVEVNANGRVYNTGHTDTCTATIRATAMDGSNKYGSCVVNALGMRQLHITPAELTLHVGESYCLSMTATPEGVTVPDISWESSDKGIVNVNHASGMITAESAGTATIRITATDGSENQAFCTVTVLPYVPVESVTVTPATLRLQAGESADLSALVLPANATNSDVRWTSDNNNVSVYSNGRVYNSGHADTCTATIRATAMDGSNKYGSCVVTALEMRQLHITPDELTLHVGESFCLSMSVTPEGAAVPDVSWESTNKSIVNVNHASGMITAESVGTARIKVIATDGSEDQGSCTVTVIPFIPVESITVTPTTLTLEAGKHANLNATVLPANATNREIRWTSDNSKVEVNANGRVYNTGHTDTCTATIRAIAKDGSNQYGSCVVAALGMRQLHITPDALTLHVGEVYCLSMSATPEGVTIPDISWESSDKNIVNVNHASGMITAESVGTATIKITATDGSEDQAFCTVTVVPYVPVESVTVTPAILYLGQKQTYALSAKILPENATDKRLTWRSNNTNVITVDETGLLTGRGEGSTTVTATPRDAGARAGTCWVGVSANEENLITSIEVVPKQLTLHIGDSYLLEAIVTPEDATKCTPYWESSAENVALVNKETGMVFAIGAGSANIYANAKDAGGQCASCFVTVLPNVSVESVEVAENTINLSVGDTCTPATEIQPADATVKALYWESDDETVAAVNPATGTITANAPGTAIISAAARDGSGERAQCTVIVA